MSLIAALMLGISGCGAQASGAAAAGAAAQTPASAAETETGSAAEDTAAGADDTAAETMAAETTAVTENDYFSKRDISGSYDESSAVKIGLDGSSATASAGSGISIEDGKITISDEGVYILSGSYEGMIVVDAEDTDKVQLVLDGASITSGSSAAIYVLSADKTFITLAEGSENYLENGGSFVQIDDNDIDAVVFSKDDLTLNGSGALTVVSPAGHGIVGKDEVTITGGSYIINAADKGITGNDVIAVAAAEIDITSGDDGLHAEHDEADKGNIYIESGKITIASGDDAVHASGTLTVCGGTIDITESHEGLEAHNILIENGKVDIIADDDGINATGDKSTSSSETEITGGFAGRENGGRGPMAGGGSGRPAMNGGRGLMMNGSGSAPEMNGGGSAPAMDGGGEPPAMGGFGGAASGASTGSLVISGGTVHVNAGGDGLDSNGTLEISGGTVTVCTPVQGDTATLDYDVSGIVSGGTFFGSGAYGMAQSISGDGQGVISVYVGKNAAGTDVTIAGSNGETVFEYSPEEPFEVVIFSSEDIVAGQSYTLTVGQTSGTYTAK